MTLEEQVLQLFREGYTKSDIGADVGLTATKVGMMLRDMGVQEPCKKHKTSSKLDEDDHKKILTLWDMGLAVTQIAERMSVKKEVVWRTLKKSGLDRSGSRRYRYDGDGSGAKI